VPRGVAAATLPIAPDCAARAPAARSRTPLRDPPDGSNDRRALLTFLSFCGLIFTGFFAAVLGSLVGLGGGFVAVPILRLVFSLEPTVASATSLVMVLANSSTSVVGYWRDKKIDVRIGLMIAAGAMPGSIVGVFAVHRISGLGFDIAYGSLLVLLAAATVRRRSVASRLEGERTFLHSPAVALPVGFVLGIASSLFGVGGGIIGVPVMLIAARMAPHVVSATSAFFIVLTAPVGVIAHVVAGDVSGIYALPLVIGALAGGAAAPPIARRLSSPQLINLLVASFILAAIGLIARHL